MGMGMAHAVGCPMYDVRKEREDRARRWRWKVDAEAGREGRDLRKKGMDVRRAQCAHRSAPEGLSTKCIFFLEHKLTAVS